MYWYVSACKSRPSANDTDVCICRRVYRIEVFTVVRVTWVYLQRCKCDA